MTQSYEPPPEPEPPPGWGEPPPVYGAPPPSHDGPPPVYAAPQSLIDRLKKLLAPIGAAIALVLKFGAVIIKLKVISVGLSMAVSVAAYAWLWGWTFALGFVLLIFVHEMGHVVALNRVGIKAGAPMFIPFLGAFVSMKESPRSAYEEAVSGIAGPIAGTLGACFCWWYAVTYDSDFMLALAFTGFMLNMFNLIPIVPLDGGRTAAALHPVVWVLGLIGLLIIEIYRPTPIIPIILILGGIETWRRWKGRNTEESKAYYALTGDQRRVIGFLYLALLVFLVFAMHETYIKQTF